MVKLYWLLVTALTAMPIAAVRNKDQACVAYSNFITQLARRQTLTSENVHSLVDQASKAGCRTLEGQIPSTAAETLANEGAFVSCGELVYIFGGAFVRMNAQDCTYKFFLSKKKQ